MRPRLDLAPGPEPVEVVGPSLHHHAPLGEERRPVVGPTVGIPDRVGQLVLDEVGPEPAIQREDAIFEDPLGPNDRPGYAGQRHW